MEAFCGCRQGILTCVGVRDLTTTWKLAFRSLQVFSSIDTDGNGSLERDEQQGSNWSFAFKPHTSHNASLRSCNDH